MEQSGVGGNNTSAINTTEPIQIEKGKYKETKEIETPEGTTQTTTTEKRNRLKQHKRHSCRDIIIT